MAAMERALTLAAAWTLWCALHSALIARPLTGALRRRLGVRFGYYRLLYNAFSVATLVPLALLHGSWRGEVLLAYRGGWRPLALLLNLAAAALFVLGARAYGTADFLGLSSARAAWRGQALQPKEVADGDQPVALGGVHEFQERAVALAGRGPQNAAHHLRVERERLGRPGQQQRL